MKPGGKRLLPGAAVLSVGLVLLLFFGQRLLRSPLRVGATADEAWLYVHARSEAAPRRMGMLEATPQSWQASPFDISCDIEYWLLWPAKRILLERHVVYNLGTNGRIVSANSKWKWLLGPNSAPGPAPSNTNSLPPTLPLPHFRTVRP